MKIIGTPKIQVPDDLACLEDDLANVPPVCQPCRQFGRWAQHTLDWSKHKGSRFKAIVKAILDTHDDVLSSYCGMCFTQDELTCECQVAQYTSLGYSLTVPILVGWDNCLNTGYRKDLGSCGSIDCWFVSCDRQVCETCQYLTLDPCNNSDHKDVFDRLVALEFIRVNSNPTGPALLQGLEALYPGSSPRIVQQDFGMVWASIGRPLTPLEMQFREYFNSILPLTDGVSLTLVEPCL